MSRSLWQETPAKQSECESRSGKDFQDAHVMRPTVLAVGISFVSLLAAVRNQVDIRRIIERRNFVIYARSL